MSDKPKQDGNDNTIGERIAKHLDGAAAVNLSEPSPGDLERVVDAYRVLRYAYKSAQDAFEIMKKQMVLALNHRIEAEKERDEARVEVELVAKQREIAIANEGQLNILIGEERAKNAELLHRLELADEGFKTERIWEAKSAQLEQERNEYKRLAESWMADYDKMVEKHEPKSAVESSPVESEGEK